MRLSTKIIVGAAVVAASVAAATFSASAPARASESVQTKADAVADVSARKKAAKHPRGTSLRVSKLSRRAADPPNPNRPYYHPVPHFYPFAQDRGYF
jgi:Ni/Co efflux regulator RcnB